MKKKVFLIFGIILFYVTCKHDNKDSDVSYIKEKDIEKTRVFIPEKLQYTLEQFLALVDSIPNSYNAPTMYMVICGVDKKDTTITFTAYPGLFKPVYPCNIVPDDSTYIKGGCDIGGKAIVVYYAGVSNLNQIINEEVLSKDFVEEHDFFKKYKGERHDDGIHYRTSRWIYKLVNGDSLVLLEKE